MGKNILVISDNEPLVGRFRELIRKERLQEHTFHFQYSHFNKSLREKYGDDQHFTPVDVKKEAEEIASRFDLVISLHCKQLFPPALVNGVKCINVHPGLNPHNRGWFPQVFSILNGKKCGATIHEIDEQLDHGAIIVQKPVEIKPWDTSLTAYDKILDAEMELLEKHLPDIINGQYEPVVTSQEGNLNLKKDFDALCRIRLDEVGTFEEHINRLRALTHGDYLNAYFLDETGRRVFLKLELFPEASSNGA